MTNWNGPPNIYVFVTMQPTKRNGLSEVYTSRIGTCDNETGIKDIIAKDIRAMRNTVGGLIEAGSTEGRTYRAFEAKWTELDMMDILKQTA